LKTYLFTVQQLTFKNNLIIKTNKFCNCKKKKKKI